MTEKFETVRLRILGEDHTIACEPGDREVLKSAASLLDEQIENVQHADPLLDTTNVFMLAALRLATNLLQSQRDNDSSATETLDSVRSVRRRVERRLEKAAATDGSKAQAAG
ncbi:MAG: cell division protein ZapA [Gammaproteobacteria bacterium]|nr:cell division protein ZapA [Gammaproteobacteria bacterium]MDE0414305.1 cell division protein ZapA [Gammaproteobacteria bacterium]